jgi:hypothetical protein
MKSVPALFLPLTISAGLALPAAVSAAVVEDFASHPAVTCVHGAERGSSVAVEDFPATSDAALVLRLAETHTQLHEANLAAGPEQSGSATVTLRARRSGTAQAWGVALRILDARGETFQYVTHTVPGSDWTTLSFSVGPGLHHDGSWGPQVTGQLGPRWRILGLAVMTNEKPGIGEFWFDDLACTPAVAP